MNLVYNIYLITDFGGCIFHLIPKITDFILLDSFLTSNWVTLKDAFLHLILPAVTLSAYPTGLIARMTRAAMLETHEQDYIRTAKAYGIKQHIIIYWYALKNAIIGVRR